MNSILYLPRNYGGRGLLSVEIIYKETKLKSLAKIITSRDPRIRLVREFVNEQYNKGRCSIFKDAIKFANDLGVTVDYGPDSFCLKYKDARDKTYETSDVKCMKNILLKARNEGLKREISSSTWQGVMFKTRWNDEHLETNCFSYLTSWKTCPVQLISKVQGLYCQLLPTKSYHLIRSVGNDQTTVCRMCKRGQESVKHVLSNCESLAKYDFILRHDSAFKCIVFPILTQYKLIDQCLTWYSPSKVKPYYENEIAEFWWDTPEYQGNEEEDDTKLFRPDAKLRLKQERQIFILEMTVPWINNREIKYQEKIDKYRNVLNKLKLDYPNYEANQLTFITDVLGGHSKHLRENISKIVNDKAKIKCIIYNMQKSVLSSAAHITRKFKLNVQ